MPRFAVIDIGTNSVKMTVADVHQSTVSPILDLSEITRLGRGVDQSKHLSDESMQATLEAIESFAKGADRAGALMIKCCGTSALRDAENGAQFIERVKAITGGDVEIISGDREAQLSFAAAVSDPQLLAGVVGEDILVFDVGGGSTELILGKSGQMEQFRSINIGAVRLTERILKSDPPTFQEIADAKSTVEHELQAFPTSSFDRVIGTGGTAVSVAKMLQHAAKDVQAAKVSLKELQALIEKLSIIPISERRSLKGLEPARADVILAGMLIIAGIMSRFEANGFVVSTRGVRFGLLLEMANA